MAAGKRHLRQSLRSLFGGFALGLITPGRLGELGRCVFVREDERAHLRELDEEHLAAVDRVRAHDRMAVALEVLAPQLAAFFTA